MKPIICSFYTPEYKALAARMIASAQKFGYATDVIEIEKINGKWIDTIYWRAEFLLERLNHYKQPIIWLDCDAVIEQNPVLFESIDGDFAAHTHDFPWRKNETLGGTMFFNFTPKAIELLETWIRLNKIMPKQNLSQKVLAEALKVWDGVKVQLPGSYCLIFDHMANDGPAVIKHYQASREFRN